MPEPITQEVARRIVDAEVRLERLETLEPSSGGSHWSFVAYVKSPTAGTIVRFRARPGTGRKLVPIRWCIDGFPDGTATFDVNVGNCSPTASSCGGNKPNIYLGRCADGNCNGWSAWDHDDHIMIELDSVSLFTQLGLTIELAPA
jgi:hypothetical protein